MYIKMNTGSVKHGPASISETCIEFKNTGLKASSRYLIIRPSDGKSSELK